MLVSILSSLSVFADEWPLHVIDNSSQGADGVRIADLNNDGRMDVVTGWEEGGRVRVCLQPDSDLVRKPWPSVTVGEVRSPEDAVFADVNGDGVLDVVSCCEGKQQAIFFHINFGQKRILDPASWKTNSRSCRQTKAGGCLRTIVRWKPCFRKQGTARPNFYPPAKIETAQASA